MHGQRAAEQARLADQELGGRRRRRERRPRPRLARRVAAAGGRERGADGERRAPAPQRARRAAAALLGALLLAGAGCTTRPLLERAERARGGPLRGLVLQTDNRVYAGMPGDWQCSRYLLAPDRYAWRIVTAADPIYLLFDGSAVRTFVGSAEVARDPKADAPLRSHARWTAVAALGLLRADGVVLNPLPAADLPPGVREGLLAQFPDGARYRLGFDERTLLVWMQGPLDLLAAGEVTVRFSDHRRIDGRVLPFAASYYLGSLPVVDETVRAACVDPSGLTPASFVDPALLPACP